MLPKLLGWVSLESGPGTAGGCNEKLLSSPFEQAVPNLEEPPAY